MHDAQQILNISFVVVLALLGIAVAKVGFAAYASTLGGTKFDKTRLPNYGKVLLAVLTLCFIYAFIISRQAGEAVGFCLLVLPWAALGCLLSVCYVPRDSPKPSKDSNSSKPQKKHKSSDWSIPS